MDIALTESMKTNDTIINPWTWEVV